MISFVIMGSGKYYPLLAQNVEQIRKVYPDARVLVYDWGDDTGRARFSHPAAGVEVIDWTARISDVDALAASIPERQRVDLAISYNARFTRDLRQRLRKAVLKRWPRSILARPLIRAGLVFENMLVQKVPCMIDASRRVGEGRMVFLDADAFLVRPLDDLFDGHDFDVAVTLMARPNWEVDRCSVVNSGVIFFGARPGPRGAFLAAWNEAVGRCTEWLREQTGLVRMLAGPAPDLFAPWNTAEVALGGQAVRLLALACAEFNNTDRDTAFDGNARVIHLANTAHNQAVVREFLAKVAAI
ncbi:MAG: hypothetical protein ACM31L_13925 [Actinomycetota bacterium]